jgi:hypothetical protein
LRVCSENETTYFTTDETSCQLGIISVKVVVLAVISYGHHKELKTAVNYSPCTSIYAFKLKDQNIVSGDFEALDMPSAPSLQ